MAHYRKITVDGKEYEYNIGKVTVYIKGVGQFEHNVEANNLEGAQNILPVTPKDVMEFIREEKKRNI